MEVLSITLNAIDAASSVINAIGTTLQTLQGIADRAASTISAAFRGVGSVLESLAQTAAEAAKNLGTVLKDAFEATAKAGVGMNISLNQAHVGLTAILGSAQAADGYIAQLRETARLTAPTFKELLPIGQQLAAVYGPQGLGQAIATIRAFDNAGKVLAGGSQDAISRALIQFRQLAVSDKPRAQDTRLIEENLPGIGLKDIFKRAFGSSDTETLGKAGVTGRQVADAIVTGINERFGQVGGQMAKSLPILFSGIQDSLNDLSATVTERLTAGLGTGLEAASTAIQALSENKSFLDALSVSFDLVGRAIETAAGYLPQFVAWLEQVVTKQNVINLLAGVGAGVQTVADEVLKFLSAVQGGRSFESIWDAFAAAAHTALDFALRAWNGFVAAVRFLSENADSIFGLIVDAAKPLEQWIDVAILKVKEFGNELAAVANAAKVFTIPNPWMQGGGAGQGPQSSGPTHAGMGFEEAGLGQDAWKAYSDFMNNVVGAGFRKMMTGSSKPWEPWKQGPGATPAAPDLPDIGAAWNSHPLANGKAYASIAERAQTLFSGFTDAIAKGAGMGLDAATQQYQEHYQQNRAALSRFLAGGVSSGGTGAASGGGGAGPGGPGVAAAPDPKAIREILGEDQDFYEAQLAAARARVETMPEQIQAQEALRQILPVLLARQAQLEDDQHIVGLTTRQYLDLETKYWQSEKSIQDLRQKVSKESVTAAKKAGDEARQLAEAQVRLLEVENKNAIGLTGRQRAERLVPALVEQFRGLAQGQPGETALDSVKRRTDLENIRGQILESLGVKRGSGGGGDAETAQIAQGGLRWVAQMEQRWKRQGRLGEPELFTRLHSVFERLQRAGNEGADPNAAQLVGGGSISLVSKSAKQWTDELNRIQSGGGTAGKGGGGNSFVFAPTILPSEQALWEQFKRWYSDLQRRGGQVAPSGY